MTRLQAVVIFVDFPTVVDFYVFVVATKHDHAAGKGPAAAQIDRLGRIGIVYIPEGIVVVELQQQLSIGIAGVTVGAGFDLGDWTAALKGHEADTKTQKKYRTEGFGYLIIHGKRWGLKRGTLK